MAARGLYFIEHNLAKAQAEGLSQAIGEALAPIGLLPYESQTDAGIPSLMGACQKVYLSSLGIFDLSVPNPDLYLQIGLSLGLNKPVVIIAGRGMASAIPRLLQRASTWLYTPPLKPEQGLQRAASRTFDRAVQAQNGAAQASQGKDYCLFCGQPCPGWRKPTRSRGFLLLDGVATRWNTLREAISAGLKPTGLAPIYLSQFKARTMPLLCELRLGVMAAEFILLEASDAWTPEQIITLGIAIGMCRPWLLVTAQPAALPTLLRQAGHLNYSTEQELQQQLGPYIAKSLYPSRSASGTGVTARLEVPFWLRLQDWIAHYKFGVARSIEGALRLLLIEEGQLKQRCCLTQAITVTAGRDPDCDLVIEGQGVTRFHADFIFTGQELFVVDRQSTNGTFVDGNSIPSGERVPLKIGSRIRIGAAKVVVWHEKDLPDEIKLYLPELEQISPQAATIVINLADGLVLADGQVPIARLSATEADVVEAMHQRGGTTATNEIAALVYGTEKVSRMIVASFMDGLRTKIESSPAHPRFLTSVPGQGYRLHTRGGQLIIKPR